MKYLQKNKCFLANGFLGSTIGGEMACRAISSIVFLDCFLKRLCSAAGENCGLFFAPVR